MYKLKQIEEEMEIISLCRGVSCNESKKRQQGGFVGKIKMVS